MNILAGMSLAEIEELIEQYKTDLNAEVFEDRI